MLIVDFDDAARQEASDPELAFPNDECSQFITYLVRCWSLLPEELKEVVSWTDTEVVVTAETLDYLTEPLGWLCQQTIPIQVTLTRQYDR